MLIMNNKEAEIFTKELIDLLKKLRLEKGLSQDQLSKAANISKSSVGTIENYRSTPTIITCQKIANGLGVKLSDIIKQIEN